MRHHRSLGVGTLLALLLAPPLVPRTEAIAAFARKYGFKCAVCHDVYPKLNPVGRSFKEAGFVFPGEQVSWTKTLQQVPVALRTELDLSYRDDRQDEFFFLKPIVAGNLGNRISFWVDRLYGAFGTQPGEGSDVEWEDFGTDNAWVRVNAGAALYVKGGKFELDLPYSSLRNYNLFAYEPWVSSQGQNPTILGVAHKGFEVGGNWAQWRYSLAVVEGENFINDDFDGDVYVRVARDFDVHRVGGFFYDGENTLPDSGSDFVDQFRRYGFDGELRFGKVDVHGVWLRGSDDQPFAGAGERSFTSGFLQGDVRLGDRFMWTNRIGFVEPEDQEGRSAYYLGLHHWALDYRLRLAIEQGWREQPQPDTFQLALTYVF